MKNSHLIQYYDEIFFAFLGKLENSVCKIILCVMSWLTGIFLAHAVHVVMSAVVLYFTM